MLTKQRSVADNNHADTSIPTFIDHALICFNVTTGTKGPVFRWCLNPRTAVDPRSPLIVATRRLGDIGVANFFGDNGESHFDVGGEFLEYVRVHIQV